MVIFHLCIFPQFFLHYILYTITIVNNIKKKSEIIYVCTSNTGTNRLHLLIYFPFLLLSSTQTHTHRSLSLSRRHPLSWKTHFWPLKVEPNGHEVYVMVVMEHAISGEQSLPTKDESKNNGDHLSYKEVLLLCV